MTRLKYLSFYLPQFHAIPENDIWWGKGFTEWTNVRKATPHFKGHRQPIIPGDLGYYDLNDDSVLSNQTRLASDYGIDGFVYYNYWFGNGRKLLNMPSEKHLNDKRISLPFCFCWANETWKGVWFGASKGKVLIEQHYPGTEDYKNYFDYLLPFFMDPRYIRINGNPLFIVYISDNIPNPKEFIDLFQYLAASNGLGKLHILSARSNNHQLTISYGFDGIIGAEFSKMRYAHRSPSRNKLQYYYRRIKDSLISMSNLNFEERTRPLVIDYQIAVSHLTPSYFPGLEYHPLAIPNWDNTARVGKRALIFKESTPSKWESHLHSQTLYAQKQNPVNPIVFIKSWNEWAEGNYLEPDSYFGYQYLDFVKKIKNQFIL